MAEPAASLPAQLPDHHSDPKLRAPAPAVQRCPNCEVRLDVSLYVAGALARCSRCGVRFEVKRTRTGLTPPPPDPRADARAEAHWDETQEDPTRISAKPEPVPLPPPPVALPLPHLEGFLVHERIGQGGMGEVYRCTRLADGKPLAVKVLSANMAAVPDYVRRFGREAAAMAQLDHPGIVRLLSRGRSGPHCWIAMEMIEGVSLRNHVHHQRPSARQLARLLAQVAHALAYAHARAVVHRDLKPDNVIVTPDARTKVLDFGLAGLHNEGAEILTQSNVAMGTANYMAPEQRKDARRADHRADLYSFGVMAYELLTGELPIGRFPPPTKALQGLDKGWDALIERCLELDPAARPHSALELAYALETLGGVGASMELAPRTRRRAGRSGIWSWLGLGAGLAVLLGVSALHVVQDHSHRVAPEVRSGAPAVPAARSIKHTLRR